MFNPFKKITGYLRKSYWTYFGSNLFSEGANQPTNKDYLDAYETSHLVNACVRKIAEKVANTKFKLYKVSGRPGMEKVKEVVNHPLLDLLAQVNPFTTQFEMMDMTQTYEELLGNSYWLKVRGENSNKPVELWQLRPDWVKVLDDPKEVIRGYEYRLPNGIVQEFPPEDIIHFKQPNPRSTLYGLPTVKAIMDVVRTSIYTIRWNKNFFKNSARLDTLLITKAKMSKEAKEELENKWKTKYGGVENAHRFGILEGEVEIKTLGATMKDMDFPKLGIISRDQILTAFGVPKSIMSITDDVNRSNAEAAIYVFLSETIEPKIRRIIERLNEFLVPEFGDDLYLDFVDPTPENREAITKEYDSALKNNWMLINEVRDREGLPPIEGGWDFYLPITMLPAGGLKGQKAIDAIKIKGITSQKYFAHKEKKEQARLRMKVMAGKRKLKLKMQLKEELRKLFIPKGKKLTDEGRKAYWEEHDKGMVADSRLFVVLVRQLLKNQEMRIQEALESQLTGKDFKAKYDLVNWDIEDRIFFEISVPMFTDIANRRGIRAAALIGAEKFELTERVQKFINKKAMKFAVEVNSTTKGRLKKTLAEGVKEGEGIPELSKRVKNVFKLRKGSDAVRIARTEVLSASNGADIEAYDQSGVIEKKEWLATMDDRVRPWHAEMDAEVVNLRSKFSNGLMFPGDPSAPADEIINCRCTTLPVIET